MRTAILLSLLLAAGSAHATEPEAPRVAVTWNLGFGGSTGLHPGYALAIDYRGPEDAALPVLALDVTDASAIARLAGLPLMRRGYRADQNELAPAEAEAGGTPWYGRPWVLWTAGGLAATAALAGGGGSDVFNDEGCGSDCGNGGVSVVSGDVVGPNDLCVMTGTDAENCVEGGLVAASPSAALAETHAEGLESGTGGMGDLLERR